MRRRFKFHVQFRNEPEGVNVVNDPEQKLVCSQMIKLSRCSLIFATIGSTHKEGSSDDLKEQRWIVLR